MANNDSAALTDGIPTLWYPIDQGYLSWSFDPSAATGTYQLTPAGTVQVVALKVNPGVITNVAYQVTTGGGTLTSGQNWVGVYQNGALLGVSADQSTAWTSTGLKSTALTSPVNVQEGIVYVAFVYNGTTAPTFAAGSTRGNAGLAAAASRFGTANASVTTALPGTLGTVSALAQSPWVAVN